jgi:hypothetical protein
MVEHGTQASPHPAMGMHIATNEEYEQQEEDADQDGPFDEGSCLEIQS